MHGLRPLMMIEVRINLQLTVAEKANCQHNYKQINWRIMLIIVVVIVAHLQAGRLNVRQCAAKSASSQAFSSSNGVLVKLVTPCGAGQTRRKARQGGRERGAG